MKLREYLIDAAVFSREQKGELEDSVLNILMDPKLARMLKKVKSTKSANMVVSKREIEEILDIVLKVRKTISKLPTERRGWSV